jgi:hypothetical protein
MFIRFAMVFLLDKTVVERRRGPSARIFVIITYNERFVNRRCAVFDIFLGEILWDFDNCFLGRAYSPPRLRRAARRAVPVLDATSWRAARSVIKKQTAQRAS